MSNVPCIMFFKEYSLLVGPVGLSVFIVGEAVKVGVKEMDGADVTGTEGRK
jgi:hypothetical protein